MFFVWGCNCMQTVDNKTTMWNFLKRTVSFVVTGVLCLLPIFVATTEAVKHVERTGSASSCQHQIEYAVNFATNGFGDDSFLSLSTPDFGIVNVLRDIDATRLEIQFSGSSFRKKFIDRIDSVQPTFTIDGTDIRRVLRYADINPNTQTLELWTVPARYDEIFESANISFTSRRGCGNNNNLLCELCKMVITEVEKLLESNYTEEKIIEALDHVCDVLPTPVKMPCRSFVATYLPKLIELLIQREPPTVVCHQLGVCTATGNDAAIDIPVCMGINTDGTCRTAKGPIPLYDNPKWNVDVTCSDCFLGFATDVFFEMQIKWFKLEYLRGGFRNMALNGALVVDAYSQQAWSTGIDKNLPLVKPTTIITFHIGPVPITVWFEIPVRAIADFSARLTGEVKVGAQMKVNWGDQYLSWDPEHHWVGHHSTPVFTWIPVLQTSAAVDAEASTSLQPTLALHVDNLYSFLLTLQPTLYSTVKGSLAEKKICASLAYEFDVVTQSQLHINIPLVHTTYDHTWGPNRIIDTGITPIGTKCFP